MYFDFILFEGWFLDLQIQYMSPGPLVNGGDSWSNGREFKSRQSIDGCFHIIVLWIFFA